MTHKNLHFAARLKNAARGIFQAVRRESSLRLQALAVFALVGFCFLVRPSFLWLAVFILFAALVLCLELLNSAFEAVLDRLHPEDNPEIGFAKDALAGAVLVASVGAVLAVVCFLLERFA